MIELGGSSFDLGEKYSTFKTTQLGLSYLLSKFQIDLSLDHMV